MALTLSFTILIIQSWLHFYPPPQLIKSVDATIIEGLIKDNHESAYLMDPMEVAWLAAWCVENNVELNTLKTGGMYLTATAFQPSFPPLFIINSTTVSTVDTFRFLVSTITNTIKWENNRGWSYWGSWGNSTHLRYHWERPHIPPSLWFLSSSVQEMITMSNLHWWEG